VQPPRVFLDASILYSIQLTDLFLRLATEGLLVPFWSDRVEAEWIRRLAENRPDLDSARLLRRSARMNEHFPHAKVVCCPEDILGSIELPDPDDRHVVAAAFMAGAEAIVTYNLKDFPESVLAPWELEALSPDAALTEIVDSEIRTHGHPHRLIKAITKLRAALQNPPPLKAWIESLGKNHRLPAFAQILKSYRDLI